MVATLILRLRRVLAGGFVLMALSPFTAPFATCDLTSHHRDGAAHRAEILAAKLAGAEDLAIAGTPPAPQFGAPVCGLVVAPAVVDESSKHQIPSRILRL